MQVAGRTKPTGCFDFVNLRLAKPKWLVVGTLLTSKAMHIKIPRSRFEGSIEAKAQALSDANACPSSSAISYPLFVLVSLSGQVRDDW